MGHQRLGRLPRTRRWREVIDLLDDSPEDASSIAAAVMLAAQERLSSLADETAVPYCYWALVRLSFASRGDEFALEAEHFGTSIGAGDSAIDFIARVSEWIGDRVAWAADSGVFADLALQSFRRTLLEAIALRERDLFGDSLHELQRALRVYSGERGFGVLARRFFGDFIARILRYFLDRELANHIGPESGLVTVDDAREFVTALDRHSFETARIMEDFAAEWYTRHNRDASGEISEDETRAFVGYALYKIRTELIIEVKAA